MGREGKERFRDDYGILSLGRLEKNNINENINNYFGFRHTEENEAWQYFFIGANPYECFYQFFWETIFASHANTEI